MRRRGFALLTVLWIMASAAVVALAVELTARDALHAASNRADMERALWRAADCLERARAAIDAALGEGVRDHTVRRIWRSLDTYVAMMPMPAANGCEATINAAGSRLDVNGASATQMHAALRGITFGDSGRLATLMLEHRPFADLRQVARLDPRVRLAELQALFAVEPGRISLNHAPAAVLETVPGFTPELVERMMLDRENGREIVDVPSVAARVSRSAADSVGAHYPDVVALTTADPDAWIIEARGFVGTPELSVRLDARIVLDDSRAAVARRRILP